MPSPNIGEVTTTVKGDFSPLLERIRQIESQGINFKNLDYQPLGRITGQVGEFDKSMAAANARVIAFGASAGIISVVSGALGNMVRQAVAVEKELTDINVILNVSNDGLKQFGNSLFQIAANTGTQFSQVAEAAKELSRQGLNATETLNRTNAALILTRLSGLEAAKSVEALTATVNTFSKEGITAIDVVNRFANVDGAFAVSAGDLATAVGRVGATAQDAKVSLNELLAVVTAVQQRTARGGAVIGEAFKSIFTRIQRNDTLDALQGIGIAVKDVEGRTIPTIAILAQLAKTFDNLSDSQKSSIGEMVGGLRQINTLKTALGDLNSEYSLYRNALDTANGTTDEAIRRNQLLNRTVSALANESLANFTKISAAAGKLVFGPSLEKVFGGFNTLSKSIDGDSVGNQVGQGILKGIGNALSGPGLLLGGFLATKLLASFTKFAAESTQKIVGIGEVSEKQKAVQQSINTLLEKNPELYSQIIKNCKSLAEQEQLILNTIKQEVTFLERRATLAAAVAPGLVKGGVGVTETGFRVSKSSGFIPNLVDKGSVMSEIAGAQAQGYNVSPEEVRSMRAKINGKDREVIYNTKEQVIHNFAGTGEPAIIPPNKSISSLIQNRSSGYVPNLARFSTSQFEGERFAKLTGDDDSTLEKRTSGSVFFMNKAGSHLSFNNNKKDGVLNIEYLSSHRKGDGTALFSKLVDYAKKRKSGIFSSELERQTESPLTSDTLHEIYPQLKIRQKLGLDNTSGILSGVNSSRVHQFDNLEHLQDIVKEHGPIHHPNIRSLYTELAKGYVPNFAGIEFYKNLLEKNPFFHHPEIGHIGSTNPKFSRENLTELPLPNTALITRDIPGYHLDTSIPLPLGHLGKKAEDNPELRAYFQAFGKTYFPQGLSAKVGGVFGVKIPEEFQALLPDKSSRSVGAGAGDLFEKLFSSSFGIDDPSRFKRPDILPAGLDVLRGKGAPIPSHITAGELKVNPYKYGDKGKDFHSADSAANELGSLAINAIKENPQLLVSILPPQALELLNTYFSTKTRPFDSKYSNATAKEILESQFGKKINFSSGYVPNFAKQVNASEALRSGMASHIPGLKDAIYREVSGTGVNLSQARVNFMEGHIPVSVTNTRDEGPSANPNIGFNRVRSRGGRIDLAGSGQEFAYRGFVPNLADDNLPGYHVPEINSIQAVLDKGKVSGIGTVQKEGLEKRIEELLKLEAEALNRVVKAKEEEAKHSQTISTDAEKIVAEQKRSGRAQQLGFFAAFGLPLIGGAASQFLQKDHPQTASGISGVTNAIGTGTAIASVLPGPVGIAIGGVVGGFQSIKSVIDNLTPSFEQLANKTQEVTAKQTALENSISGALAAQSNLKEISESQNASPTQLRIARQNYTQSIQNITDPDLQKQFLANSGNTSKQDEILAKQELQGYQKRAGLETSQLATKFGDDSTGLFGFLPARRNRSKLNEFLTGDTSVNDDGLKKLTDENVRDLGSGLYKSGFGKGLSLDDLNAKQAELGRLGPNGDLKGFTQSLGVNGETSENVFRNLIPSDFQRTLKEAFNFAKLGTESDKAGKTIEAFAFSIQKFNIALEASSSIATRIATLRVGQLSAQGNNSLSALQTVNAGNAQFNSPIQNLRNEAYQRLIQNQLNTKTELAGVQTQASNDLSKIGGQELVDNPHVNESARGIIERGTRVGADSLAATQQLAELLKTYSAEGVKDPKTGQISRLLPDGTKVLTDIEHRLAELNTKTDAIKNTSAATEKGIRQQHEIEVRIAENTRIIGSLRGSGILDENGLDVSKGLGGQHANISRIRQDLDPDYQRKTRAERSSRDSFGRATFDSQRLLSRARGDQEIGEGIRDDLQTGLAPRDERTTQRLAGVYSDRARALLTLRAQGSVSNLQQGLRGDFSSIDPTNNFRRLQRAASTGDYDSLQREALTLRGSASNQGKGVIDEFISSIPSLTQALKETAQRSELLARRDVHPEGSNFDQLKGTPDSQAALYATAGTVSTELDKFSVGVDKSTVSVDELTKKFDELSGKLQSLVFPVKTEVPTKAQGFVPSYALSAEQDAINHGVGGARRTDSPLLRNVQGLGLVAMNSGEQVIDNYVPGKAAILNRQMMGGYAKGYVPNFADVGGVQFTGDLVRFFRNAGYSREEAFQMAEQYGAKGNIQGLGVQGNAYVDLNVSPLARRVNIAHEAFHASNPVLGQSETLAKFYGEYRGATPGTSFGTRLSRGIGAAVEYNTNLATGRGGDYGSFFNRRNSLVTELYRRSGVGNAASRVGSSIRSAGSSLRQGLGFVGKEEAQRAAERNILSGSSLGTDASEIGLRPLVGIGERVGGAARAAGAGARNLVSSAVNASGEAFPTARRIGDFYNRIDTAANNALKFPARSIGPRNTSFPTFRAAGRNVTSAGQALLNPETYANLPSRIGSAIGTAARTDLTGAGARAFYGSTLKGLGRGLVGGAAIYGNELVQNQLDKGPQSAGKTLLGLGSDATATAIATRAIGLPAAAIGAQAGDFISSVTTGESKGGDIYNTSKELGYGELYSRAGVAAGSFFDAANVITFGGLRAAGRALDSPILQGSAAYRNQLQGIAADEDNGRLKDLGIRRSQNLTNSLIEAKNNGASADELNAIRARIAISLGGHQRVGGKLGLNNVAQAAEVSAQTSTNPITPTSVTPTPIAATPVVSNVDAGIQAARVHAQANQEASQAHEDFIQTQREAYAHKQGYRNYQQLNDFVRTGELSTSTKKGSEEEELAAAVKAGRVNYAGGFDPLHDAIGREGNALARRGLPASAVYVDHDPRVGVAVANRFDEPNGVGSGINRVLASGGNPRVSGAVSNYASNNDTSSSDMAKSLQQIFDSLEKTRQSLETFTQSFTQSKGSVGSSTTPQGSDAVTGKISVDATVHVTGGNATEVGNTIAEEIRKRLDIVESQVQTLATKNKVAFPPVSTQNSA